MLLHQLPRRVALRTLCLTVLLPAGALAQWDPANGQWGKDDANALRVMTWNVQDGICSTNPKVEGQNNWCAIARTIAAFQPDVLLLQECGDNSGNGTGGSSDSAGTLTNVVGLLINGGSDPYLGGSVGSYVKKYAPSLSLSHVFVSTNSDNFNRNVILSRYPFSDLNGDTRSTISDIPNVSADEYAIGGDGGIRGFMFAEIDLPGPQYIGDLVVGNAHLKAGSNSSDHNQRLAAAMNVAYYVDYLYNGAGTGLPDPHGKISDSPPATQVLNSNTPVILGGDWNEDELSNGTKGPAEWLSRAEFTGSPDGTDRDGSDMLLDTAVSFFGGSDTTIGSSKFDYLAHQDSLVTRGVQTVFHSNSTPTGQLPPEVAGFPSPNSISTWASDHRPVIADYSFAAGCTPPSNYCVSAPNSAGLGAFMSYQGSTSFAANDLVLGVNSAVPSTFGLFFYGALQDQAPLGNGFRCVSLSGSGIIRLNPPGLTSLVGDYFRPVDYSLFPMNSGVGQILPGSIWNFQFWYRDQAGGGAGFNTSDGLEVLFCP
jgi:endonuclease/exonuclease/phosphatase family metal-dependent hydrolase